jgi:hypothetical protein
MIPAKNIFLSSAHTIAAFGGKIHQLTLTPNQWRGPWRNPLIASSAAGVF